MTIVCAPRKKGRDSFTDETGYFRPVAPVLLGPIKRLIGKGKKGLRAFIWLWDGDGGSDADRNNTSSRGGIVRNGEPFDVCPHRLSGSRCFGRRSVRQNDGKFLTPIARCRPAVLLGCLFKRQGDFAQTVVPALMAVRVVEPFERIDVDHHDGKRRFLPLCAFPLAGEALIE